MTHLTYFRSYVWGLLIFTVAVIISGDIVQSTESGAGCGDSWPKCEGSLVPAIENIHTAIEFIHRALTSVLSVGYLGLLVWSYLLFGRRHLVWRSVLFSSFVLLLEIFIGAALVFFGWVEDDASWGRVIVDSLHVVNTLILLASLVLILFWASESENRSISKEYSRGRFLIAAIGIVMVITHWHRQFACRHSLFLGSSHRRRNTNSSTSCFSQSCAPFGSNYWCFFDCWIDLYGHGRP